MEVRKLCKEEEPPLNLLLLADLSEKFIKEYVSLEECFIAEVEEEIIGVYIFLPTRPGIEELRGRGI